MQFIRNGYDHPWVEMNRIHKSKKTYRKRDRKNFDYDSFGFLFVSSQTITISLFNVL